MLSSIWRERRNEATVGRAAGLGAVELDYPRIQGQRRDRRGNRALAYPGRPRQSRHSLLIGRPATHGGRQSGDGRRRRKYRSRSGGRRRHCRLRRSRDRHGPRRGHRRRYGRCPLRVRQRRKRVQLCACRRQRQCSKTQEPQSASLAHNSIHFPVHACTTHGQAASFTRLARCSALRQRALHPRNTDGWPSGLRQRS